ncbi:MAG: hypothetical protein ABIW79_05305 [Gemmatimonas sp.]
MRPTTKVNIGFVRPFVTASLVGLPAATTPSLTTTSVVDEQAAHSMDTQASSKAW